MHLLIDGKAYNSPLLRDAEMLKKWLVEAAGKAKMHVFGEPQAYHTSYPLKHPLTDTGLSGVVFLGESSITIHTYPEFRWVSIDLYSCKDFEPPGRLLRFVRKSMVMEEFTAFCFKRGIDLVTGKPQKTELLWQI